MKFFARIAAATMAALAFGMCAGGAAADDYPSKTIHIVVPYPPGSVTDLLGRTIAQKITASWNLPVIVENRGGGGSTIGTDIVANATPDGYTILIVAPDLAINQSLRSKLSYDAEKSFAPITLLVFSPTVLCVNPSLPVNTLRELITYAKFRPGQLSYSSGGNGTGAHLGMELLKYMAEIDIVHIPYKGVVAAITGVLAGEVQVTLAQMSTARSQILAGKLRALAVASSARSRAMPDLPTVAEAGLPGFKADVWFGVVAPAGTPSGIVSRLNSEIAKVMRMPDVQQQFLPQGIETKTGTPDEFAAFIHAEIGKWAEVVKRTGARID